MSIIKNGKKVAGSYNLIDSAQATNEKKGIIRIATNDEAKEGILDNVAVTPKQLSEFAGSGLQIFDTILKDHILSYEESKGLALQGTYMYKEAVPGSRYGYPDFYNKVIEEFENSSNEKKYVKSNVNLVGALSDEQGLLSGFNTSTYATLPTRFAPTSGETWEMVIKFNSPDVSTNQGLFGYNGTGLVRLSFIDNKVTMYLSTSTSTFNIGTLEGTTALIANSDYWVKVIFNGTSYQLLLSTDGIVFNLESSIESTTIPEFPSTSMLGYTNVNPNKGTIDLNESYININGKRWWTGTDILEYKKNPNGHMFYDIADKTMVDYIFASTGMAWFYGVDTENERIFLPRDNFFAIKGIAAVVGNGMTLGLTDGVNNFGFVNNNSSNAISYTSVGSYGEPVGSVSDLVKPGLTSSFGLTTDPTKSGIEAHIEANADKYLYICVGNTETQSSSTDIKEATTENDTTPLFTGMYFDFIPNNISWLKAGEQKQSGGIYSFCYNELIKCLNEQDNIYNLKVINEADMISGVDYSQYWKLNQDDMYFVTPTAISSKALSGAVAGNGMTLGFTNGSKNFGQADFYGTNSSGYESLYGADVGSTTFTNRVNPAAGIGITTDPTKSGIVAEESSAQLYFKVANAVENLQVINAGEILESLNDKIGRQDCVSYLVETYCNGTSWYRVYSDGWCEQGGECARGKGATNVVFLIPFINTNYTVTASYSLSTNASSDADGGAVCPALSTYTTNGFRISQVNASTSCTQWHACGFIR